MPIRLFDSPNHPSYKQTVENLQRCCKVVDQFIEAVQSKNLSVQMEKRVEIQKFVPGGVYQHAMRGEKKYIVFGVQRGMHTAPRTKAFFVVFGEIENIPDDGKPIVKGLMSMPLVHGALREPGFLQPIEIEDYCGPRYLHIGEVLT